LKKYVIIAAGGIGKRMITDTPKQFLCLKGIPILIRSISIFVNYDEKIQVILVLPSDQIDLWKEICKKYSVNIPHTIVLGGETRFHSVKNGLSHIQDNNCIIAVHDAARPLVSTNVIDQAFKCAEKKGSAIPFIPITDSIRIIENELSKPIDRTKLVAIQTPQCFKGDLLQEAYKQPYCAEFTDDATVVEKMGIKISLINGNPENFKITTPIDILFAEALLKK